MPWQLLGTFPINFDWETAPQLLTTAETFRFTSTWDGEYVGKGKITIAFEYGNEGTGDFRSIYPSRDPQVLEIPIPEAFKRVGLVARNLKLKRSLWSKVFYEANWLTTVEAFVEDGGEGIAAQVIDGGEDNVE
jgi:hypothetical protein